MRCLFKKNRNVRTGGGAINDYGGVSGSVNSGSGYLTNNWFNISPRSGSVTIGVPSVPKNALVGRDEEKGKLKKMLGIGSQQGRGEPIVTLAGIPGVGKTMLAWMLTDDNEIRSHFTDGVLWASLGKHPNLDEVFSSWARGLNIDIDKTGSLEKYADSIRDQLGERRLLIVLDDVWDAKHASPLLRIHSPYCAHLLTTRNPSVVKDHSQRRKLHVGELSDNAAKEMLLDLCPRAKDYPDELRHLIRLVGGLPLALMLIGRYLASRVTIEEEAEAAFAYIRKPSNLLALEVDSYPAWHRWLPALIRWLKQRLGVARALSLEQIIGLSVDALLPKEQKAFTALASFAPKPHRFSAAAAMDVVEAGATVIGDLERFGLLEKGSDDTMTMHQSLHLVAYERAERQDLAYWQERHSKHYLNLMRGHNPGASQVKQEWDQIEHAWRWVSGTNSERPATSMRGQNLILDYINEGFPYLQNLGLRQTIIAWINVGLASVRSSRSLGEEANLLMKLGGQYLISGHKEQALQCYNSAIRIYGQMSDRGVSRRGEVATRISIGHTYLMPPAPDLGQAKRYFEQAQSLAREIRNPDLIERAQIGLDEVEKRGGRTRQ